MLKGGIPIWNFIATLDISPGHHFDLIECIHQGGGDIMIKVKLKRHINFFSNYKKCHESVKDSLTLLGHVTYLRITVQIHVQTQ